jgi:23S rRNA (guanosine2251-2'-O)-methyltransferase
MRKLSMDELNRKSVEEFRMAKKIPVIVVLDNVRSMHNVGSIFRSSDAFLLEGIYLCGYTPRPPHRDIHKTALGATETVHWEYHEAIMPALQSLQQNGYTLFAVEQAEGSILLQGLDFSPEAKIALVFGNEVEGVQQDVIAICDQCIEIPQAGMKHSLNIAVAAGIVFWELFKKLAN